MKATLAEIHALRAAGLIGKWAIGGAMGATFYLEPVSTYDLDIFGPLMKRTLNNKKERRKRLMAPPYPEKVRIVERLRAAAGAIKSAARRSSMVREPDM